MPCPGFATALEAIEQIGLVFFSKRLLSFAERQIILRTLDGILQAP